MLRGPERRDRSRDRLCAVVRWFTDPDTPLKYGFGADVGGSSIVLTDEAFSNQAETSLPIQPRQPSRRMGT